MSMLPSGRLATTTDGHAGHDRAGRVRAVRGSGDQDDVPIGLTAVPVVRANHHQAREFPLGS